MLPLSDRDSRYFKGIPVLFEDGSFKSLKPILKARLALPHLTDAVRDRLRFDLALVDLRLKDAASRLEAEDLLIRLDAFGAPYEIREASGIILSFWKESRHERQTNAVNVRMPFPFSGKRSPPRGQAGGYCHGV